MNKRILLLILGISLSVSAILAETSSYFAENTRWGFLVSYSSPNWACVKHWCVLQGDTTIEGKLYQKISYNKQRIVPIREDGKKIYAHVNDKDVLLNDFNIKEGDAMPHYADLDGSIDEAQPELHVAKVDSITLLDGRRAKRIKFDNGVCDIEYIGREHGILAPLVYPDLTTCGAHIMCCSLAGEPIYESYSGSCQTIHDFFELPQATKWYGVVKSVYPDYVGLEPSFSSETYFIEGDTTINGITYQAVRRNTKSSYFAGLRESIDGQQVYIIRAGSSAEMLLFDFNVQVKDTVYAYDHSYAGMDPAVIPGEPNYDEYVKTKYRWVVQDVQVIDGRKHVVVKGGESNHTVEWIEGIGTKFVFYENNQYGALATTSIYALCAVDSEENTLYSFNTDGIGIRNKCPDWEIIDSAIDKVVKQPASATKLLRDGQMFIIHDGKTYSVTGQEVK